MWLDWVYTVGMTLESPELNLIYKMPLGLKLTLLVFSLSITGVIVWAISETS